MDSLLLSDLIVIAGIALGGATLIALIGWALTLMSRARHFGATTSVSPVFLFDGPDLSDATPEAQLLIKNAPTHMNEKQALLHTLNGRFPMLDYALQNLSEGETDVLNAADDSQMAVEISLTNDLHRVKLIGTSSQDSLSISEVAAQDAVTTELNFLRAVVDASPQLMWMQDPSGQLSWANKAYLAISDQVSDDPEEAQSKWPDAPIFPDLHIDADAKGPVSRRIMLPQLRDKEEAWFQVTTQKQDTAALHFADDVCKAVVAEQSKGRAVQAFGRIFGNLSTGLAIFDQRMRLSMFNPALTELTQLKPDYLMSRPTLDDFLDVLRDNQILPEPKNYSQWREQFVRPGRNTSDRPYCENWNLSDGQTFRVTAQPYRDESFAFFFEDVTAEVALTRRFRSDVETCQGVIDTLPEAIAVFSDNGTLVMTNTAYQNLWNLDHKTSMHTHDLRSETVTWQRQCAAAPAWGDLRNYIARNSHADVWAESAILDDGRQVDCSARRITNGMTMVSFGIERKVAPVIHKLTMADSVIPSFKS